MSVVLTEATPMRDEARLTLRARSRIAGLLRWATVLVLVAGPLGFGATTTAGGIALIAASWLLLLIWLGEGIRAGRLDIATPPWALPVALLLAFTAIHWTAGISVTPIASQLEWLRWIGYAALAVVAAESFTTARRLRGLAKALAVAGFFLAGLGIAQYLTADGKIYWVIEPSHGGQVFGPYVNHNHFAGLMELWIGVTAGLALMPENSLKRRWFWCSLALVMCVSVVLSGSRGGILALAVEVLVLTLAVAGLRGGRRAVIALLIALAITGAAAWALDRGEVFERYKQTLRSQLAQQEEASFYRLQAWRGSLRLFREHWLFGSGLDTFVTLFPAVRPFPMDKVWTHAHNDFLQFLAETGLVGALLGGWILWACGRSALNNLDRTRGTGSGAILLGMAAGCLGFLVHGWLDFNFHIPANAANFAVLGAVLTRGGWSEE